MIREFDTSEFLSTLIINRFENHKYNKKGEVGFKRVFMISHRVMRENPSIRIKISSTSIKSFCAFAKIQCDEQKIILTKADDKKMAKLSQYKPLEDYVVRAFTKANF